MCEPQGPIFGSPPRLAQEETLRAAFSEYGNVQHAKVIKDKGGERRGRGGAGGKGAVKRW